MYRWVKLVVFMGLTWMLSYGCVREIIMRPQPSDGQFIQMTFSTGQILPATKSGEPNDGLSEESALHQIQVWVFNSGNDDLPLAYKEVSGTELARLVDSYGEVTITMDVDGKRLDPTMLLDFYVAANASGSGINLAPQSKPSDLDTAILRRFTPSEAIGTVPAGGLPISRVVREVDGRQHLSTAYSTAPPIKIPLVRAVSKISFYMVRPVGLHNSTVERIAIDGNTIGREEYFFPEPAVFSASVPDPSQTRLRDSGGYHSTPVELVPQDTDICYHPDPEDLKRRGVESINDYVARIRSASVSPYGITYLKESDKAINGTVYYTMGVSGTQVREAQFSLDPGLFIRNHEWIVYIYFSKDRLYVCPEIAPWTDAGLFSFDWNYTYTLTNQTGADTRILTEGGTDYVMCAWGRGTDGLPYSPKLQIERNSSIPVNARMLLLLDNPDFGFVEEDGGVLSAIKDYIDMPLSTTPETTVFYVVPKYPFDLAGPNPANPEVQLKLILTSAGLASIRLPFNVVSLPGDTEAIRYHYVTPDQFR